MGTIENRMISEAGRECAHGTEETSEKLKGPGREEIGTGIFVAEEDAYKYAMERIFQDEDLRSEFVEWFYSGNWVKEE